MRSEVQLRAQNSAGFAAKKTLLFIGAFEQLTCRNPLASSS
jgi:hypothetical protein